MSLDADDADDDETASLDEGDTSLGDYDEDAFVEARACLLYTSPSPRDLSTSRMPSSA